MKQLGIHWVGLVFLLLSGNGWAQGLLIPQAEGEFPFTPQEMCLYQDKTIPGDCIIGHEKGTFTIYSMVENQWITVGPVLEMGSKIDSQSRLYQWRTYDLDNDGIDEVIATWGRFVGVASLHEGVWSIKYYHSQFSVKQFVLGDFDKDGRIEWVVFRPEYSLGEYVYNFFEISIARLGTDQLDYFWHDNSGQSGYRYSSGGVVPPANLIGIMDIHNQGQNQLVIADAKSDMSTQAYITYSWIGEGLVKEERFYIPRDGELLKKESRRIGFYRPFSFFQYKGETLLIASGLANRSSADYLVKVRGNHIDSVDKLFDHDGYVIGYTTFLFDPDGKGFMAFRPASGKRYHYSYFRLLTPRTKLEDVESEEPLTERLQVK